MAFSKVKGFPTIEQKVRVEEHLIGRVIGRKGQTVQEIQRQTGASIRHTQNGVFSVKGTEEQCSQARRRIEEIAKPRKGQAGKVGDKIISFITALDGNDQVKFTEYEGDTPVCWKRVKDPKIYYLEADDPAPPDNPSGSVEDMRNYDKLESNIREMLQTILERGDPVAGRVEIRFGKVLWLSESKEAPSDEVLFEKHRIRELENDGVVSVDSILGKTRWNFVTELQESDAECLNLSSLPLVGEADIINISFKAPDERDALRSHFKCTMEPGKEPVYHLLEVASSLKRNLYYDCLHLEGQLDMRVALRHFDKIYSKDELFGEWPWTRTVAQTLTVNKEKETINFYGYPPECQPNFIRHVRRKLYLCVHEGNQYILAHFDLNDCDCEGLNGPFEMEGYHEEFELWNVQWMADFAQLEGSDWREVFANAGCDVSKLPSRVQPKKIEVGLFLEELRRFVQLALQITAASSS
jgi:rRNA processing protein Krr1/Pno1